MQMGKVEIIEQQVQELSSEDLARFRDWFLEFDWQSWDRQLERDVQAGKLDALAEKALTSYYPLQTSVAAPLTGISQKGAIVDPN